MAGVLNAIACVGRTRWREIGAPPIRRSTGGRGPLLFVPVFFCGFVTWKSGGRSIGRRDDDRRSPLEFPSKKNSLGIRVLARRRKRPAAYRGASSLVPMRRASSRYPGARPCLPPSLLGSPSLQRRLDVPIGGRQIVERRFEWKREQLRLLSVRMRLRPAPERCCATVFMACTNAPATGSLPPLTRQPRGRQNHQNHQRFRCSMTPASAHPPLRCRRRAAQHFQPSLKGPA